MKTFLVSFFLLGLFGSKVEAQYLTLSRYPMNTNRQLAYGEVFIPLPNRVDGVKLNHTKGTVVGSLPAGTVVAVDNRTGRVRWVKECGNTWISPDLYLSVPGSFSDNQSRNNYRPAYRYPDNNHDNKLSTYNVVKIPSDRKKSSDSDSNVLKWLIAGGTIVATAAIIANAVRKSGSASGYRGPISGPN